jgi:predicted RNase H-like HicB family nuclease
LIEPTATGFSAHGPDLPGCIAAASSLEEMRQLIKEAIAFHIEAMRDHGDAAPDDDMAYVEQIEVSAQQQFGTSDVVATPHRMLC